ncbi:MAG: hypothetical protein Q6A85_04420 [Enterococcus mundtii]|nr:hypothetical protein [Enterococcus mundtii]
MTYFTKEILQKEMEAAGFAVSRFYGDVKGSPYDENSPIRLADKNSPTPAVVLEKKE